MEWSFNAVFEILTLHEKHPLEESSEPSQLAQQVYIMPSENCLVPLIHSQQHCFLNQRANSSPTLSQTNIDELCGLLLHPKVQWSSELMRWDVLSIVLGSLCMVNPFHCTRRCPGHHVGEHSGRD